MATDRPAWQRLGLKLKSPNVHQDIGPPERLATQHVDPPTTSIKSATTSNKRKANDSPSILKSSHANLQSKSHNESKAAKSKSSKGDSHRAGQPASPHPPLKKQKVVTFGETPTKNGGTKTSDDKINKQTKVTDKNVSPQHKKNKPAKKDKGKTKPSADLLPALEYLRHWDTSRDSWKFNKNHQSSLIKHAFDTPKENGIPASDIGIFYRYIQDLKGFVRKRLRDMALEVRVKDLENTANFGPPKQQSYDSIISQYWTPSLPRKRKSFDESDFLANSGDDDDDSFISRVVKRLRAEMIIDELSDGELTDVSTTSATTTVASSTTLANGTSSHRNSFDAALGGGKVLGLTDGVSKKRKRKLRTAVDDSSSSESDSDSDDDSDTSSSGSSSDESDSDSDAGKDKNDDDDDDSSSSSSSDSSDSSDAESDSGSESDDEEEP